MFLTCMHFNLSLFFFYFVADTERTDTRRMWYICCKRPCRPISVLTAELPIHAFDFVCICHCYCLNKIGYFEKCNDFTS
jgi:hypothetical protein